MELFHISLLCMRKELALKKFYKESRKESFDTAIFWYCNRGKVKKVSVVESKELFYKKNM